MFFLRVDLGVVHPDEPGRYLAGVECDGAAYHSSATVRDRDRLREIVFRDLGWNIRRIWSTDWWMTVEATFQITDPSRWIATQAVIFLPTLIGSTRQYMMKGVPSFL